MSALTTSRRRLWSVVVGAALTLTGGVVLAPAAMAAETGTITTACATSLGPGAVSYHTTVTSDDPNDPLDYTVTYSYDNGYSTKDINQQGNTGFGGFLFGSYGDSSSADFAATDSANHVTVTITDASGGVLAAKTVNRADCGTRPGSQPTKVTPSAPVSDDEPGTAHDTYTIPKTEGVDYVVNGKTVAPGTYPATGEVTVKAVAQDGYKITGKSSWTFEFTDKQPPVTQPTKVTPPAPVFTDKPGKDHDTVTVPASDCVTYLLNGKTVAPGTYPATGEVTVKAVAKCGECVLEGQTTWPYKFSDEGGQPPVEQPGPPASQPVDNGPSGAHNPPAVQPQVGSAPVASAGLNQGFGANTEWNEQATSSHSNAWKVGLGLSLVAALGLVAGALVYRRRTRGTSA